MKYSWFLGLAAAAAVALPSAAHAENNLLWVSVNDAMLEAGDKVTLSWSMPEGVRADFVNINVIVPGLEKLVVEPIAANIVNTGTFTWTAPDVDVADAYFEVTATDLASAVAAGTSPHIVIGQPIVPAPVEDGVPSDVSEDPTDLVAPSILSLADIEDRNYLFTEEGTRRPIADASWIPTYDTHIVRLPVADVEDIELDVRPALPPSGAVATVDLLPGYYLVTADASGERLMSISDRDAQGRTQHLGWTSVLRIPFVTLWAGLIR